jgi:hypothetical protein
MGSSVSIMSDYGLDDRDSIPGRAKDSSPSTCVQTGSGAHPASCPMGTGSLLLGVKRGQGRDADHSPPSSAEVKNEQELYLFSPQAPSWRVAGQLYFSFAMACPSCYTGRIILINRSKYLSEETGENHENSCQCGRSQD